MARKLPRRSRAACHLRRGRRWQKRLQTRQERQRARLDPENAPTRRNYKGWAD